MAVSVRRLGVLPEDGKPEDMILPDPAIRAVTLDAMGTLVRLDPPAPRLRAELHARFGIKITEDEAERAMRAEILHYRAHMHFARDARAVQALREDSAEALRAALTPNAGASALPRPALTEALLAALHFTAYPDAEPALGRLRELGLRVLVVSNWDASLPEVLGRVGLARCLDGVISSAAAGAAKPSPAIFHSALDRAGVPPDQAVHVGDSVQEDVAGARASGMAAVWLDRSGRRRATGAARPGVPRIESLSELLGPSCPRPAGP